MKRDFLPRIYRGGGLVTLTVALLALALQSCLEPMSMICPSGRVCPVGQKCAANQDICITTDCGDGIPQTSEACDDGNIIDGDGCSQTCKSDETCGNGVKDESVGEQCDDGNTRSGDKCSADCSSLESCGNGFLDSGEPCDDGNNSDEDNCLSSTTTCILATCGDGKVDKVLPRTEECDPADTSVPCNLDCTTPRCGDGIVNASAGEQCDDGKTDGSGNPVDTAICNKDCTFARCGDGHPNKEAKEECDDGNADACGTCNADCSLPPQTPGAASGSITAVQGSSIRDGEILSISDGHKRLYFEFNKPINPETSTSHIPITIENGYSAEKVAEEIRDAINLIRDTRNVKITADIVPIGGKHVELQNHQDGSIGNQPIIASVGDNDFIVTGMDGGIDACSGGVGCTGKDDCQSSICNIPSDQKKGTCQP